MFLDTRVIRFMAVRLLGLSSVPKPGPPLYLKSCGECCSWLGTEEGDKLENQLLNLEDQELKDGLKSAGTLILWRKWLFSWELGTALFTPVLPQDYHGCCQPSGPQAAACADGLLTVLRLPVRAAALSFIPVSLSQWAGVRHPHRRTGWGEGED